MAHPFSFGKSRKSLGNAQTFSRNKLTFLQFFLFNSSTSQSVPEFP